MPIFDLVGSEDVTHFDRPGGHIGLIAGSAARKEIWPDMAAWLNSWGAGFAARTPDALHSATFFPEPGAAGYVAEAIAGGARVFKAHLQVGGYDPRDELLDPVWGMLAEARVPVVVHCGSGPMPGAFTGPGPISGVLARHPRLIWVMFSCAVAGGILGYLIGRPGRQVRFHRKKDEEKPPDAA